MCKSGRKTHEGPRPLNPAIESLTIGRLHALCKILPAMLGAAFDLVCSLRPLPLCGGVTRLLLLVREGKKLVWCTIKKLTKDLDIFVSNRLCLVVYHFAEVLVAHTELLI